MNGERPARNIQRRAHPTGKYKQVRMLQRQHHRAKSSHGHANNCAMRAASHGREAALHVSN
jgi:hypothetical protein